MSINFATLQGLTIPEGVVTQITDAAGNVLWEKAPAGANVKVTLNNGGMLASQTFSSYAYLYIDGEKHNAAEEIVVPIGTVITCYIDRQTSGSGTYGIYLNDTEVSYTANDRYHASYDYTVTGDIEIVLRSSMTMSGATYYPIHEGFIHITES